MSLSFPIATDAFSDVIPHRKPMLWVDDVESLTKNGGRCRLSFDREAHYTSEGIVRPSSFVEWVAQAYAFVRAAQWKQAGNGEIEKPKEMFLAAVRDGTFMVSELPLNLTELYVDVETVRELTPLYLVKGVVSSSQQALFSVQLKLFCG